MLKLFPLPSVLLKWAARRVVNVAVFGNGLSLMEWEALQASYWRHHKGFMVNVVSDPAQADLLAVHGPLTNANWSFFERWLEQGSGLALVMAVGAEVRVLGEHLVDPAGQVSAHKVNAILPGHPPSPEALKSSLASLLGAGL